MIQKPRDRAAMRRVNNSVVIEPEKERRANAVRCIVFFALFCDGLADDLAEVFDDGIFGGDRFAREHAPVVDGTLAKVECAAAGFDAGNLEEVGVASQGSVGGLVGKLVGFRIRKYMTKKVSEKRRKAQKERKERHKKVTKK